MGELRGSSLLCLRTPAAGLVWLTVVAAAPFVPVLVDPAGRVFGEVSCDLPGQFYFYHEFAAQCRREGTIPLWNPYVMLGVPFLGEGQAAFFHPLSTLTAVLPTATALNWMVAVSVVLGSWSFWGYLRSLEIAPRAALCGALAWTLSTGMLSRVFAGHLSMLMGAFCAPLVLMFWERYRRGGGTAALLGAAAAYGCLHLAGHPQSSFIFSLFLATYVGVQTACDARDATQRGPAVNRLPALAAALLVGVGLACVQLLPTAEFARQSFRSRSTYEFCTSLSLPPENLLTLICPGFFGTGARPGAGQYWGRDYFWEAWLYLGILPLLALPAGLARAPRDLRWPLAVCAAAFLVLALGEHTPVYRLFYQYVPLYDVFRSPAKHLSVTLYCLAALSAFGFAAWFEGSPAAPSDGSPPPRGMGPRGQARPAPPVQRSGLPFAAAWALVALILLLLAVLAVRFTPFAPESAAWRGLIAWRYALGDVLIARLDLSDADGVAAAGRGAAWQLARAVGLTLTAAGVLAVARRPRYCAAVFPSALAVLLADLMTFAVPLAVTFNASVTEYPESVLAALRGTRFPARIHDTVTYPNKAMRYRLSSLGGYTGAALRRYNRYINATQNADPNRNQAFAQIRTLPDAYRMLSLQYLVQRERDVPPGTPVLARDRQRRRAVTAFVGGLPRAFLAEAPHAVADDNAALTAVLSPGAEWQKRPAVETHGPLPAAAALDAQELVRFVSFAPNAVRLDVTAARDRLLVLNEAYDPGWTAEIDGRPAPVLPVNYLFRGVIVPPGRSSVTFEYRSPGFRAGAAISGASLALLVAAAIAAAARGKR